jgi:hypothetical protein
MFILPFLRNKYLFAPCAVGTNEICNIVNICDYFFVQDLEELKLVHNLC